MGWFESDSYEAKAYSEVQGYNKVQGYSEVQEYSETIQTTSHKPTLSHELIAGAAAYEAAKAYENHVANNGRPDSHAKAKEIVAGLTGAFIDRIIETKGLDYIDHQKAKQHAKQTCHNRLSEVEYSAEYNSREEY